MKGKAVYMTEQGGWSGEPQWGIDWGTSIPPMARVRFLTKEDAEEYLRFHNDARFWKQYEPDFERIARRYGQYHKDFPDKVSNEEWNKWEFEPWELPKEAGFERRDFDAYWEEVRDLITDMYETWKGIRII
jgi:hypothetical protein